MLQDLRVGLRMLRAQPGFTLIAVLALALGIGATTLIFSVVNAVVLRPLSFPDADRIVRIEERHQGSSLYPNLSYATFLDLSRENTAFEYVAAARFWTTTLTEGDEPEAVPSMVVSADYFRVLGVTPILGRDFLPEDDVQGNDNVVILGHALWQRRFGGDPAVVGRAIRASSKSVTVIGILPPGHNSMYPFAGESELWSPLAPGGSLKTNRRSHLLGTLARVKRGVGAEQAAAELANIARGINEQNPGVDDPDLTFTVTRLSERVAQPIRQALIVFLAAVGLLLLIACANVANLMLARAAGREREMAIRSALGAGRLRLARQLFTESLLLSLVGGATGLALAYWATKLVSTLNVTTFPRINEVNVDARVLGFAMLVSLLTGVLFGMAPVLQLPSLSISGTLKEGGRGVSGAGRGWLRKSLIVSEVALAMVLLIGAGLLINSFVRLMQTNRGFNPTGVLTINMNLPGSRYPDGARQAAMLEQVVERVSSAPGVTSVGLTSTLPFSGGPATTFVVEGREAPEFGQEPSADIRVVDENYFHTLAIPIKGGRSFSRLDSAQAPRVMIINEEMAQQYWPGENPIGRLVTMKDWGPPLTGEIVGVAGNVKADGLDTATRPMIYWRYTQFPTIFNNLVVRAEGDPLSVLPAVKSQIQAVDSEQALARIRTMDEVVSGSIAPRRFNMLLLGVFAALALILAAVGIYGVVSYTTAQRTHEFGVRLALGASAGDVLKLVVGQGLTLVLVGIGMGLAAAFLLTRVMSSLLFEVTPTDPVTYVSISILLAAVALFACWIPARRATRVDPMVALRQE